MNYQLKEKKTGSKSNKNLLLKKWNALREEVSKKWDKKVSGIEEIRDQRSK